MSAFEFIRKKGEFEGFAIFQKMSKTHPQEHEDYLSEIKKEMTSNRQSREDVLCQPMNLSPELADVIGKKVASRAECIYILGKITLRLQDPENRRNFIPDTKMAKIWGNKSTPCFGMAKFITSHMSQATMGEKKLIKMFFMR